VLIFSPEPAIALPANNRSASRAIPAIYLLLIFPPVVQVNPYFSRTFQQVKKICCIAWVVKKFVNF
jgi:hypothetical protein